MGGTAPSDAPAPGGSTYRGDGEDRLRAGVWRGLWQDRSPDPRVIDLTRGSLEDRILSATLRCLGRWGTVKTTLDDIAREAGCSRATVYRTFPGGKDALFVAAGERELLVALTRLAEIAAAAGTLEELISSVLSAGVATIRQHKVLTYLCEHEPGVVLPYVSFDGMDPVLGVVCGVLAPHLERFVEPSVALDVAEWMARVGITYGFEPFDSPDLTDPNAARRFVQMFLMPGLDMSGIELIPTKE